MTPQSALSIRQKLDDLVDYKSDVRSNGQRIIQWLRTKYDEFLWQKLPWLKEIDAKYAPERQFWESIRKDIYKSDGTLKDNALSVVSNITNKGNEARLARMESILPWIGEKVKALKAFEDVQNASGIKVGTYGRAATTGAIALASVPLAIASWVATHPVVVSRVLESIGLASQKIKSILAKWKNITKEDANIIQQAVAKTPKSKVEWIINNLSYDPKTSKLTSKTIKNGNNIIRPVTVNNKWNVGEMEQIKKPLIKSNESKVINPTTGDTIPEGYTKNAFWEIIKKPWFKKWGYIWPWTKHAPEIVIKWTPEERIIQSNKLLDSKSLTSYDIQDIRQSLIPLKNTMRARWQDITEIESILKKARKIEDDLYNGITNNIFGETIKKPSNSKGGFIKIGSEPKKLSTSLIEEARKYKNAEDFEDAINNSSNAVSADKYNLGKSSRLYMAKWDPETHINLKDFQKQYWYEAERVWIKNIWNNWKVTIYRSATWDIQPWDWIAFDKKYAEWHSRTSNHKVYSKEVPVEDVLWAGTSGEEWFYAPKEALNSLKSPKQIYEQAHAKKLTSLTPKITPRK